jgi:hypothetical protein
MIVQNPILLKEREAFTSLSLSVLQVRVQPPQNALRKINLDSQGAIITADLPDPNVRSAVEPCPKLKQLSPVPGWHV